MTWRCAGGCSFDHDPDRSAVELPPIWSPRWSPTTLTLIPAEPGFSDLPPIPLDRAIRIVERPEGCGIVLADDRSRHYLWMRDPEALTRPAISLPVDAAASSRDAAIERFLRHIAGKQVFALPPPLRLTSQKITRLIHELQALDFYLSGMRPREIAYALLDPSTHDLRAIEWKSSAMRRHVMRLLEEATTLMEGGYRDLLRGEPTPRGRRYRKPGGSGAA